MNHVDQCGQGKIKYKSKAYADKVANGGDMKSKSETRTGALNVQIMTPQSKDNQPALAPPAAKQGGNTKTK